VPDEEASQEVEKGKEEREIIYAKISTRDVQFHIVPSEVHAGWGPKTHLTRTGEGKVKASEAYAFQNEIL
jgi:hypothetical protein